MSRGRLVNIIVPQGTKMITKFTKNYVGNFYRRGVYKSLRGKSKTDLRTNTIYAAPNSESDLDPEKRIMLGKRMFIKRVRKKYFLRYWWILFAILVQCIIPYVFVFISISENGHYPLRINSGQYLDKKLKYLLF